MVRTQTETAKQLGIQVNQLKAACYMLSIDPDTKDVSEEDFEKLRSHFATFVKAKANTEQYVKKSKALSGSVDTHALMLAEAQRLAQETGQKIDVATIEMLAQTNVAIAQRDAEILENLYFGTLAATRVKLRGESLRKFLASQLNDSIDVKRITNQLANDHIAIVRESGEALAKLYDNGLKPSEELRDFFDSAESEIMPEQVTKLASEITFSQLLEIIKQ